MIDSLTDSRVQSSALTFESDPPPVYVSLLSAKSLVGCRSLAILHYKLDISSDTGRSAEALNSYNPSVLEPSQMVWTYRLNHLLFD